LQDSLCSIFAGYAEDNRLGFSPFMLEKLKGMIDFNRTEKWRRINDAWYSSFFQLFAYVSPQQDEGL
jgi:hypothetical protein